MRIGIVIRNITGPLTGVGRFITSVLDALQKIDPDNTYFIFEKNPSGYVPENKNWKKISDKTKIPGLLWLQCKVPLYCRQYRIDTLWVPEQICPFFGMKNVKIVSTIYDLVFIHYPQTIHSSNLRIMKLFIPPTLKKSHRVVTISNFIKADIEKHFPFLKTKVDPVYCGHPDWKEAYGTMDVKRGEHLLFVGNYEPRKNLINIFKALEILLQKGKLVALHIAGPPGWNNKEIKDYIENSPVKDQVKLLGYITEQQLSKEYQLCKAFIFPSLYEGFGLPVLEALLMECPVITSQGSVMEEIAEDSVLYCDPYKPEDIADKILDLDRFIATPFKSRYQKVLSKYSWEKTAQLLLKTFSGKSS